MSRFGEYRCPACGEDAQGTHGITLAWLEWMTCPVKGTHGGKVAVDYGAFESGDLGAEDEAQVKNVPNKRPDLEHMHCNKCGWNWFDHNHDDADGIERAQETFLASINAVPYGHYRDVVFVRDYKGEAATNQFNEGEVVLADPITHRVSVEYKAGAKVHAGVFDDGNGVVSLELEGFDYGVGYLHGLTCEDIRLI